MDPQTKDLIEKLSNARLDLARVDTINEPAIASAVQANLRVEIERLELALRHKVFELEKTIRITDHRDSYNQRMDREEILSVLGDEVEEPERDTPKLNALMRAEDAITFMEDSHVDFQSGPSLEEMLLTGNNKALKAWVGRLTQEQLINFQKMAPILTFFVTGEALNRSHDGSPNDPYRKLLEAAPWKNFRGTSVPTELLNDEKPGSFDD